MSEKRHLRKSSKCSEISPDNLWEWGREIYHSDASVHILFGILCLIQTDRKMDSVLPEEGHASGKEGNLQMQAGGKGRRGMELKPFSEESNV